MKMWIVVASCSLVLAQAGPAVVGIEYQAGDLADSVTLSFSQEALCIYEPVPLYAQSAADEVRFLLPDVSYGCRTEELLSSLERRKDLPFSFDFSSAMSGRKGLRLQITYDPEKISWSYETGRGSEGRQIVFLFWHKKQLSTLSEATSALRSYA